MSYLVLVYDIVWRQMAFNRAEKARTNRLSDACLLIQTAFRRHMFQHEYQVTESNNRSINTLDRDRGAVMN